MNPMIRLALTAAERQALWQLKRDGRSHEERRRAGILLDAGSGLSRASLAERHGCACSTVDRALSLYRRGGGAALRSGRFKPHRRKVGQAGLDLLATAIRQTPRAAAPGEPHYDRSLWTLPLLADYLAAHTGVRVDDDTVRRYLLHLGWTTKSPKLSCTSPDPGYSAKMAAIQGLREQAQKGGCPRRWSSTMTRPS
jgi:transposase